MNLTQYEHLRDAEAAALPGPILFYRVGEDRVRARSLPGGSRGAA
jgi:hypothetical protein